MNQIIITSHSTLAQGFYEAVKFFQSNVENVHYINAYVDHPNFEQEFLEKIKALHGCNIIVFTDILGGSVNQIAMKHYPTYHYHLVSGTNLAVLLETIFKTDDISADEMHNMVVAANQQLVYVNDLLEANAEDEEE